MTPSCRLSATSPKEWAFRSFNDALRSWIATVALVEIGYEGEWEEYTNELTARDYLDEVRRRSGSDWPQRFDEEIAPWDERFRAATVEEAEPHLPPLESDPGWWQYRSPRHWIVPSEQEGFFDDSIFLTEIDLDRGRGLVKRLLGGITALRKRLRTDRN